MSITIVFTLKKGATLHHRVQTAELGSPTEVYMVLLDAKGAQLQARIPAAGPARLHADRAGDYVLQDGTSTAVGRPDESIASRSCPMNRAST